MKVYAIIGGTKPTVSARVPGEDFIEMDGLPPAMGEYVAQPDGTWVADIEGQAEARRAERDRRLVESDWTQLAGSPLDQAMKEAWAAYRQALRDVPQQEGFPRVVEWPESPVG